MAKEKKKKSLFRRMVYLLVMTFTGGGAGLGGWLFKDYPQIQALFGTVVNKVQEGEVGDGAELKAKLVSVVADALKKGPDNKQPGVYKVTVSKVTLEPKLFSNGRTVDIQARIRKVDAKGQETTLWESKAYGENLAVVGKGELAATWRDRPFEIDWASSDKVLVDVWDRKGGFLRSREFRMARPESGTFPLSAGAHRLELTGRDGATQDSDLNQIVFQSQRVGDSGRDAQPAVASKRGGGSPSALTRDSRGEGTILIK